MATGRPNILLIVTDTQRCDTLRCMGNPHALSPNLDRLASEGVLFEDAHTSSPVCMPARCSLLTGVHTPVHGCIENGMSRREHLVVFPDLLKTQGYTNIMVGKTHFGPIPESLDVVLGPEYADVLRELGYDAADLRKHPTPIAEEHFRESYLVDRTIEEMEKAVAADRGPFFAFCSMTAPHPPETPPGDWGSLYDDIPVPPLNYVEGEELGQPAHTNLLLGLAPRNRITPGEGKTEVAYWREAIGRVIEPEHLDTIEQVRRLYYGYAAYCDAQVGRLLAFLDARGLREDTLVVFSSDHGQQYFDHGFNDKHNYYDASWRVPLILSMPGTIPSGQRRSFAIWNDITTTLLAAAGVACPTMQGFDLLTPLSQGLPSPRECAVGTLFKSCALATRRWKLAAYLEEDQGQLFDRVNDPLERTNLYTDPEHREVRDELLSALLAWRSDLMDLQATLAGVTARTKPDDLGYRKVAQRAALHTRAMRGTDAEKRLNQRATEIDARYGVGA